MNKNKKWYSLFLVMLISLATVIQPIQAVAAVTALDTVAEETQAKSMETPNVDNIDETNKVVEEGPATSVSEETKTTDTIEETISSEVTEETTASEEKTVESSTEETKESKEKPKAKKMAKEDRDPIDISTLLNGEVFLPNVTFKAIKDKQEIDHTKEAIPSDALIQLIYDYNIPQSLLDKKLLKAGDYYDIKIPEQIRLKNFSGDLKGAAGVFGRYELVNGVIRLTFNEKVEELNEISGSVNYAENFKETVQAGENIIKIPLDGKDETIKVSIKPNGGESISKHGEANQQEQTVRWNVSINTELDKLTNAVVTDVMPKGLIFRDVKVYPQTVKLNGEITVLSEALRPGIDYIASKTGDTVKFIGDYAETNQSFKLVYETDVDKTKIPEEGGSVRYDNTATLSSDDEEDISASNDVSLTYGKLIEKLRPKVNSDPKVKGHVYDWTVKYNYGYKKLPAPNSITDTVSKNLAYIDSSVKVKTVEGKELEIDKDYTVSIKDNQMEIIFIKELDTAVDVTYQTKAVDDVAGDTEDVKFTNNVKTDGGFEANSGGQIATDGLVKWADVDYENRKINWSIQVNKYQYHMANWELSDTMSPGLTFNPDTFRIYNEQSGEDLVKDTHYTLKETDKGFDVAFIGDLAKGTDSTYRIVYTTDFEPRKDAYSNTATTDWKDRTGKDRHESVTSGNNFETPYVKDVIKSGSYNAQTKKISWDVIANHNQETLSNASIVDPIMDGQDYVPGSARLFEMKVNKDGSLQYGTDVSELIKVSEDGKTISANLPNNSKSPYKLVFETSLEGKLINQTKYHNVASYTNKGVVTKAEAEAEVTKGNIYGEKFGEVDKSNENFVKWSVNINPSQSTVKDMTVIDKPSNNQVLEESSIIVYGANVSSGGDISANRDVVLEKGKDYTVNIETNNETGQQVLTVKFVNEISKAYVLEYRSMANTSLLEDYLTNNISVTGNNEKAVKTETSSSVKVVNSSGTATGTTASVKIVKIDKNSKEKTQLSGAKFELWTINGNGKKGQLVRSGQTDVNGELKFGNLRPNTDYLLFETKAPTGFTVSQEMRYGQKVNFSSDGEINLFKSHTVENDMPRIRFGKVDGNDGHVLADAKFMVKNEQGEFYNGIDNKYRATWVDSQDKVSDDVKQLLTSDENGQVEVAGLSVGTYSIQEIVAPKGYDKVTKEISFKVINDEGLIRLENDITVSNMPYETTSVSINKTWDDASNQDGIRPDEITFDLLADGTVVDTLTLSKEDLTANKDIWTKTFDGLRKFDEDMKEITYSVKEHEVSDYVIPKEASEVKDKKVAVTNTYTPEVTSISGTKTWVDENDQDGIRPDKVIINLLADGKEIKEVVVNEASEWKYEFKDLPVYKVGEVKQLVKYTVTENKVEGYETTEENNNFTNTHIPATTRVLVEKDWADYNNQDGKRPKEILVQLLADNKEIAGKTLKLEAAKGWKAEFSNLPLKINGKNIAYTIKEIVAKKDEDNGYNPSYDIKKVITKESNTHTDRNEVSHFEAKVTNTKTMEPTTVSGVKTWSDDNNRDGVRPESIEIELLADGQPALDLAGEPVKSLTVKGGNTAKTWSYEFTNIPKHRTVEIGKVAEKAEEIVYTVKEVMSEALKTNNYASKATDTSVTNSREIELTKISGIKTWSDDNNRDGVRPESIEVQLLADGKPALDKDGKEIPVKEVKGGNTAQEWTYEFKDLPKHKAVKADEELVEEANRTIVYTVKEIVSEELESNNYTSKATDMNVTNSREIELTQISGVKTWSDDNNRDGVRPELIEVQLLADGEPALDKDGKEIPVKEVKGGNTELEWTYEFKDLPKHKAVKAGEELVEEANRTIVYTVKEVISKELEDNNYTSKVTDMDVTNSRPIELTEVSGKKIWNDNENRSGARPKSIEVQLLADGQPALDKDGKEIPVKEVNGKNSNDTLTEWTYEFKDLPKHKAVKTGEELVEEADRVIVYTVKEVISEDLAKNGYIAVENGMDVTNTREVIEIPVTKIWKDANNKDGVRPESIKVQLLADGKEVKDLELTGSMKSNEWIDTFKDLPKFANGKEIKYSVKEIEVSKEYEVTYSDDTFTITNTHTPKEVPTSGGKSTNNKSNNNKSGYLPKTGEAETTALVNLGVTMIVIFLMSHIWVSQRRKSKED